MNKENEIGMTPMHAACLSGSIKAVDLLLDQMETDFMKKDKVRNEVIPYIGHAIEKLHSFTLCGG